MSESLNLLPLVLGIIGTVTGIFAIVFSYLNYKFQKPNLTVKVKRCWHSYEKAELFPAEFEIRFSPTIEIKNKGDRGTTMSKIELSFVDFGKNHFLEHPTYGKQFERVDEFGQTIKQTEFRWINPTETIGLNPVFLDYFKSSFIHRETIDYVLTVFTTRKNYEVKFTSINVESYH
jgi:hypothetical protein